MRAGAEQAAVAAEVAPSAERGQTVGFQRDAGHGVVAVLLGQHGGLVSEQREQAVALLAAEGRRLLEPRREVAGMAQDLQIR